ncbi:hypothetical protein J6590_106007 [Homalodisca vitripennis]|nr:hypothetical protein J6590_080025 [Homalodisca vitripennis]KAG8299231.1 hypothetical protein J6590_106007 [Homalodisca vitripennis]
MNRSEDSQGVVLKLHNALEEGSVFSSVTHRCAGVQCSDKKPSMTLNLVCNALKVSSEPPPMAKQACKDRIAQQPPIQIAATLNIA